MRLVVRNGFIMDENENIFATIVTGTPLKVEKMLEASGELLEVTEDFLEAVEKGKLQPKTSVKKFETVLDKYNLKNL